MYPEFSIRQTMLERFVSAIIKAIDFRNMNQIKVIGLIVLGLVFLSCSQDDDVTVYETPSHEVVLDKTEYSTIENEILNLVNQHRVAMNLSELALLPVISNVSDGHTKYMIEQGEASHDNFQDRVQQLMNNANAIHVGENVAYGYRTAAGVFNAWLNSPGHREIIENADYTHFGISADLDAQNRYYFTQMFISK